MGRLKMHSVCCQWWPSGFSFGFGFHCFPQQKQSRGVVSPWNPFKHTPRTAIRNKPHAGSWGVQCEAAWSRHLCVHRNYICACIHTTMAEENRQRFPSCWNVRRVGQNEGRRKQKRRPRASHTNNVRREFQSRFFNRLFSGGDDGPLHQAFCLARRPQRRIELNCEAVVITWISDCF